MFRSRFSVCDKLLYFLWHLNNNCDVHDAFQQDLHFIHELIGSRVLLKYQGILLHPRLCDFARSCLEEKHQGTEENVYLIVRRGDNDSYDLLSAVFDGGGSLRH